MVYGLFEIIYKMFNPGEYTRVQFKFHFFTVNDSCKHALVFFKQGLFLDFFVLRLFDNVALVLLEFSFLGQFFIVLGSEI